MTCSLIDIWDYHGSMLMIIGRCIQIINIRRAILLYQLSLISEIVTNHEFVATEFLSRVLVEIELVWIGPYVIKITLLTILPGATKIGILATIQDSFILNLISILSRTILASVIFGRIVMLLVAIISLEALTLVINRKVKETTASRCKERIGYLAILPPDRWKVWLILLEPLLSIFFVLCIDILNPFDILLFATIMASQNPTSITKYVYFAQFVEALYQSFYIIRSYTEQGIVFETFWERPISNILIFHPKLCTVVLYFFFNEFWLKSLHGLTNLVLIWSGSLKPFVFFDLL